MPLTLEVIGNKTARMGSVARKTFVSGGTIGRLPDNDWVFPDEYISGHHARISFVNGAFLIEDTSTNGVFLNSQQNRLTRNKPQPLRSGDILFIDDYQVRVSVERDAPAVPAQQPLSSGASLIPGDSSVDAAPGAGGIPNSTDPLALLGFQSAPAVAPGRSAASLQSSSPLAQHYRPPEPIPPPPALIPEPPPEKTRAPASAIPDDYDPFGSTDDDPFAARSPAPVATSAETPATPILRPTPGGRLAIPVVVRPRASVPPVESPPSTSMQQSASAEPTLFTGPPRVPTPGARSAPSEDPFADAAQVSDSASVRRERAPLPLSSEPVSSVEIAADRPASPPAQPPMPIESAPVAPTIAESTAERRALPERTVSTPGPAPAGGDLNFAALLAAAGLDGVQVTPELSQQFGMILKVVVAGLMDVLRARGQIKDEFRMRMTTFKQKENNPLKFSANVEDALHNLLVKRNAAFLGPVQAFEDAFLDVRHHQMAMLAGVRVAYQAMLNEFEPDALQKEFEPHAKGANFLSGGAKTKYWELYRTRFRDMVKDADTSFRHLFGDDFAKAYEEQLTRLRASERAGRQ